MGKNILSEDIQKMMGLINYDRSKTLTENKNTFKNSTKRIMEAIDFGDDEAAENSGWTKPCEDITGWGKSECKNYVEEQFADWKEATDDAVNNVDDNYLSNDGKITTRAGTYQSARAALDGILKELEKSTKKTGAFVRSKLGSRDKSWAETEVTREGSNNDTGWVDTMEGGGSYDRAFENQVRGPKSRYEFTLIGKVFGKRASYYDNEVQNLNQWIDGEGDLDWGSQFDANVTNVDIIYDGKEYENFKDFLNNRLEAHFTIEFNNCVKAAAKCEGTTADSDVNFDKLKINGKAFPWKYNIDVDTDVKTAYESLASNKKYTDKWSPEFLWANAYYEVYKDETKTTDPNLGWTDEFYLEWPGDGKRVVETETLAESTTKRKRIGYGFITEGGVGRKKNKDGGYSKEENRAEGGGDEDEGGDEGGAQSTQQTKCTFEKIIADETCAAKKGQKGPVIGEIQEKLKSSGVEGTSLPKHGADKDFGPETEAAVKAFQTAKNITPSGIVNSETAKALQTGGQPTIPENQVAAVEQKLTDADKVKAATVALQQKIAGQPTKEQCVTLVGTAAAGLKYGTQDGDKLALGHCFNTYNFIGIGGNKVKKAYNLKGKGNPTK